MIVWLASYPKSGNTWIRLFLDSLLFKKDRNVDINNIRIKQFPLREDFYGLTEKVDDENEFVKNCIPAQTKINLDNKIKFLKTHQALWQANNFSFTNEENTLGVIHIVRDPRNVITSILNYFNRDNYMHALEFISDPKRCIGLKSGNNSNDLMTIISSWGNNSNDLMTIISSWGNHYNSWKKFKKNNLLIKYENLLIRPEEEFVKICNFIEKISNLKFEKKLILKAVQSCDFNKLCEQEKSGGFIEGTKNKTGTKKRFFDLGPKNNWQKLLDKKISHKIEKIFEKEMLDVGYL